MNGKNLIKQTIPTNQVALVFGHRNGLRIIEVTLVNGYYS